MAEETGCSTPKKANIFGIFSNDYRIPEKQEFCRLLREGDLEKAVEVLAKISPSKEIEPACKVEALVTLIEGYRTLAQRAVAILGKPGEEVMAYRQLGTPAEIADRCRRLKEYEAEYPDIAELKAEIKILGQYRNEFGTPEEAKEAEEKLRVYEAMGEPEDLKCISELAKTLSDIRL